jgi:hypothetical protein
MDSCMGRLGRATVPALIALAMACGTSNSETGGPPAASGGGGSPAAGGGGGSPGAGGGGGAQGDSGTTQGAGFAPADGPSGACPPQTSFTLAVHIVMNVTWQRSVATNAGEGKVHLWNRTKVTATGTQLSGETQACGSVLPEFGLTGIAQVVAGGSKVLVEFPDATWDAPSMSKFQSQGTMDGWNPGNAIHFDATNVLIGLTMPDANAPWPDSYTAITTVDADGDGKPGVTAVPRNSGDYVKPPTGLTGPKAETLYISSRTVVALSGMLTSCETQSGTADVKFFDNHVVGCHTTDGQECSDSQTDFIDVSRTQYEVLNAAFESTQVAEGASCAVVRAALPM